MAEFESSPAESGRSGPGVLPTIAVIIPTHNRVHLLARAVGNVCDQTFGDWELIIMDDGSTDGTVQYLTGLRDPRIRFQTTRQQGAAAARNAGLRLSTAPFVTFLDSDDEVVPDWLETLVAAFIDHQADIVTTAFESVGADGTTHLRPLKDRGPIFDHVRANFTHAGCWAARRDILLQIDGFSPDMPASQHTELAFRLLPAAREHDWRMIGIDRPLLRYHAHSPDGIRGDDQAVLDAAEYMIAHHGGLLRRDPPRLARSHGVAGVRAARLSDPGRARWHFARAVRANPRQLRAWIRLFVSWLWPLRPRSWRAGDR